MGVLDGSSAPDTICGSSGLDIDHLCSEIFPKYMRGLDEKTFARAQAKMYVGVTDIDTAQFGYLPVTSPAHLIDRLHTTMALPC
ncbi:hypothetical protein HZA99_03705 [Candidatus Woesearchaeota archaeon]|nr:hypothetical protein [Candidatus Woesearchaeota archaeon]